MDDRDVKALLEKYRPAEPPAELHASIHTALHQPANSIHQIANPPIQQLTWPWAVAAAALLAIAVAFHGRATAPTLQASTPTASQLAEGFGGGPAAMAAADFILSSPLTTAGRPDIGLSPGSEQ